VLPPIEIYENALRKMGLDEDFTLEELERQKRRLALIYHPDKSKENEG
jgi:curved DNA-binding protein CbpA